MRRFSINVDLRDGKKTRAIQVVSEPAERRDGLVLSQDLAPKRQAMREWGDFQRKLMALSPVTQGPEDFADPALAEEYVRIYAVSREKILAAAPGFEQVGKLEQHCYFEPDGSKHLISRLLARPHARVTELSLYPGGELERLYYENAGGLEQNLDDLYEFGLGGLDQDLGRFAAYPHYRLKFVSLLCKRGALTDIYRGVSYYDPETAGLHTQEDTP